MPVRKLVQGYLFRSEGIHSDRDNTVCKIEQRADDAAGEVLMHGPCFWVSFSDDPDNLYFAYGFELSPWFPTG